MTPDLAISLVYIGYAFAVLLTFGAVLTWVERKQAAIMADRIGANRAYLRIPFTQVKLIWWGLFHGMADGLKLLLKEDFKPVAYDRLAYALGPWVVFTPVMLVFAVIPFGGTLDPGQLVPSLADWFGGRTYPMQIAPLDAGLLVVFAFGGISIIGAMLAGWSSANKFSLLGAVRAGSDAGYSLIDENGIVLAEAEYEADGAVTVLDRDCRVVQRRTGDQLRSITQDRDATLNESGAMERG